MDNENNFAGNILRQPLHSVYILVRFRYINIKIYECFIEYTPNSIGILE